MTADTAEPRDICHPKSVYVAENFTSAICTISNGYRSHCCLVNAHAGGQQAAVTQLPEAKQRRVDVPLECLEKSLRPFPCTNRTSIEQAALHLDYRIAMQKAAKDTFLDIALQVLSVCLSPGFRFCLSVCLYIISTRLHTRDIFKK